MQTTTALPGRWTLPPLTSVLLLTLLASPALAAIRNAGFEEGLAGWRPFWARDKNTGSAMLDTGTSHSGKAALRIEHRGAQDWSLEPDARLNVQPGDLWQFEAWFKMAGEGNALLCVSTWDADGKVGEWSFAERSPVPEAGWQRVRTRFVVPPGVAQIQPRLIGYGPVKLWVDDFALTQEGNVTTALLQPGGSPPILASSALRIEVNPANGAFQVQDKQSGRTWRQQPLSADLFAQKVETNADRIVLHLLHAGTALAFTATLRLEGRELLVELQGQGEWSSALKYPHPFAGEPGDYLAIPMNEGISYPVEDQSVALHRLVAYGGHGICMAFFGATDGTRGWMGVLETPDDAAIKLNRSSGRLVISPEWDPQKRQFGYARRLRYVFFTEGGHVAIAKRYRAYAKQTGLLKTLEEKRKANPNVDLLAGAVNIWCWDRDAVPLVREIQAAGIERILWSNRQSPTNLAALNALGVLTSRYDIYQDVMNPENFPRLRSVHADWTTKAWPNDIILGANGQFIKGWGVETRDGGMVHCGVICDRRALDYARERIPAELATHPYRCRFIDTTTAAPWHECYNTNHPMTRSESRQWKMELLRYVSEDNRLVTGCETGHEAAVPFLHYFEGMLSLGPYRVPDAGRRMQVIWTNVPEAVAKFQLGHNYRLPLWELVYHDCVIAQWYWGDYNNKLPALWDKRDLFNALYGTPPMFMFDRKLWTQNKARFVQSYRNTCPLARKVAYAEMTDHRFLTPDRRVQQTAFANGVTVTVNFGEAPFQVTEGKAIPALGLEVTEAAR
jgi:hypothetical protein